MSGQASADTHSRLDPFFVHVGSFVAVIVYFVILGQFSEPTRGIRIALPFALAVMSAYALEARRRRLLKYFDIGLWMMFAAGTAAVLGGCSLRGGEGTILGVVIGASLTERMASR